MKARITSIIYLVVFSLIVSAPSFAQHSDPRWEKWNREKVADSTFVGGHGVIEFWLYRVDTSAGETNIMKKTNFPDAFMLHIEELGFIVDYNSVRSKLNFNLNVNVRRLMAKHGANVSVVFLPNNDESITVVINLETSGSGTDSDYDYVTFNVYQKL